MKIKKVKYPSDLNMGDHVFLSGTVRGKHEENYIEVEVHDGICGLNVVRMRVHYEHVKIEPK